MRLSTVGIMVSETGRTYTPISKAESCTTREECKGSAAMGSSEGAQSGLERRMNGT